MVQNKTFSAKALQTFVAVMFAVITCFGFMTTPTAEAASGFLCKAVLVSMTLAETSSLCVA